MHPAGNFTTAMLSGGRAATQPPQELGGWQEGQISCRSTGDIVGSGTYRNHLQRDILAMKVMKQGVI